MEGSEKAGVVRVELVLTLPIPADQPGSESLTELRDLVTRIEQIVESLGTMHVAEATFV